MCARHDESLELKVRCMDEFVFVLKLSQLRLVPNQGSPALNVQDNFVQANVGSPQNWRHVRQSLQAKLLTACRTHSLHRGCADKVLR